MSPIDDELRSALQGRADLLLPAADPLLGIERRAKQIRRNRVAASLTGTALAVAAIAVAVPALTPSQMRTVAPPASSTSPAPSAEPAPASPAAFSFEDPWTYRGGRDVIANGNAETFTREWAASRGVGEDEVDVVPLYGEVYEPSGAAQVVYAARVRGTEDQEYGLVVATEGGPEFVASQPLTRTTTVMVLPAPGDEVPRLLVVAAPDTRRLEYAPDGEAFRELAQSTLYDDVQGTGVTPLEGDLSADAVRVTYADGGSETVAVPDPEGGSEGGATGPDNLLGWGFRGQADPELEERAARGYATAVGAARQDVEYEVLLTGGNDGGQAYTVLQAWTGDGPAQVFGWIESPGRDPEPQLRPATDPGAPVVAILLTEVPGQTASQLVLIPEPATGAVLYTARPGAAERPVQPAAGLDGVVIIDRDPADEGVDRLRLLDGDGDLDAPTFDGAVSDLLCGVRGCS